MPTSTSVRRGLPRRALARRAVTAAATATALLAGAATAAAAPAPTAVAAHVTPASSAHSDGYAALRPFAELSAERLATGDLVAAAKWGTDSPIDDPAREKVVLDSVAERARQLGADPERTVRVFRDQIEANKVVQRGLHDRWDADPAGAPTERPDLGEVRKEINRVNERLVQAIAASQAARTAPSCGVLVTASTLQVVHRQHLDGLHTVALARALRSVCG